MVETTKHQLTADEYYKLLVRLFFQKSGWVFLVGLLSGIVLIVLNNRPLGVFLILFCIIYPIYNVVKCRKYSQKKENQAIYLPRVFRLTEGFFEAKVGEEDYSKQSWENFSSIKEIPGYFMVYVTASSFIIIPKSAFKSEEDKELARQYFGNKLD